MARTQSFHEWNVLRKNANSSVESRKVSPATRAGTWPRRGKGFAGVQLTLNTDRKVVIAENEET